MPIWEVLRDLRDRGRRCCSDHYLEEVEALADRMAIIDGRVIAEGSPDLKQELGGDRVTLRVREFSDQPEAEKVRHLLEGLDGVRRIVM